MAVSRRSFIATGVSAAIGCTFAPIGAFGAGRPLPRDGGVPGGNAAAGANAPAVAPHEPQGNEALYQNLARLDRDSFQSALGSPFKVSSTSGKGSPFWLRLLAVQNLAEQAAVNPASMAVAPPAAALQAIHTTGFSLDFSGGPVKNLKQNTFFFAHSELGQFALFIVPAGPQQYTAVINRLPTMTAIPV